MSKESFSHQFVDYAAGRKNPPQLTVMVGPAGSGKSTVAKAWVNWGQGKVIRFNRDSLCSMLFGDSPWNHRNEDFVRKYEENGVRLALSRGLSAIVDDTNCTARRRLRWERMARASRAAFDLVLMNASEKECIERNKGRTGKECVPEEAIRRQFQRLREAPVVPAGYEIVEFNRAVCDWQALLATGTGDGLVLRLPEAQVVFCDVDGTLADHEGVRDQYDESKVLLDRCREPVAAWLRALYPTQHHHRKRAARHLLRRHLRLAGGQPGPLRLHLHAACGIGRLGPHRQAEHPGCRPGLDSEGSHSLRHRRPPQGRRAGMEGERHQGLPRGRDHRAFRDVPVRGGRQGLASLPRMRGAGGFLGIFEELSMIINGKSYPMNTWLYIRSRFLFQYLWMKHNFPTLARYYWEA